MLDNHGEPGDAATAVGSHGSRTYFMGATSTVVGAAILHAIAARAAEIMLAKGEQPDVFISANVKGGDEHNAALIAKYIERVDSL